uniref:Phospho-2-dehydro-3-deoxyheptonate aldolase n=4 Tax=Aegilops tauschii subsp. strangulata TaxID=200361 RepID=A0A453N7W1_AEGTS
VPKIHPPPEASAQSPGGLDWIPPAPPAATSSVRVHLGETKGAPRGRRPALLLRPPGLRSPGRDCAGSFKEFNPNNIRDTFRLLLQMGNVLMFGGQVPVVKMGRMAGQFAKRGLITLKRRTGLSCPATRRRRQWRRVRPASL